MRTALAILLSACLGATAAQAVCISGVDCVRERFGPDPMTRNNQIIDRTTGFSSRNTPANPYVARQGLQVTPGGRTIYNPTGQQAELETLRPNQLRPDAGYAPGAAPGTTNPYLATPYAPGPVAPGTTGAAVGATTGLPAQPYAPKGTITGQRGAGGTYGTSPYAGGTTAQPSPRDPNRPVGATDAYSGGAQSPGSTR